MICYSSFVDVLPFAPVLTKFLLVISKAVKFGLGGLDQPPSTPAPEPQPSESKSSTQNQLGTTPVQAESSVEMALGSRLGDQGGVEVVTAPVEGKTPPGELQLLQSFYDSDAAS